jgi:hypothetical protein
MRIDKETNREAPRETNVLVRSPAVCCRHCRSKPIAMPISRAAAIFAMKNNDGMLPLSINRPRTESPPYSLIELHQLESNTMPSAGLRARFQLYWLTPEVTGRTLPSIIQTRRTAV